MDTPSIGQAFTLRDAASAVVIRQSEGDIEVLLLKRSPKLAFASTCWVFPGGKVDDADIQAAGEVGDQYRLAAVRETKEEAGLDLDVGQLQYFFRITTPSGPIRFNTAFFLASVDGRCGVKVDGSEIVDSIWLKAEEALEKFNAGLMSLMVPTGLILMRLTKHKAVGSAFNAFAQLPHFDLKPQYIDIDEYTSASLYPGDACYDNEQELPSDAQHRVIFNRKTGRWGYIHNTDDKLYPALDGGYSVR